MKKLLKTLYMLIRHPIIFFFSKKFGKHSLIIGKCDINQVKYLEIYNEVRIGSDSRINFYVQNSTKPKIKIGKNTYIGNRFTILCAERVEIESNVLIASSVFITDENHGSDPTVKIDYGKQKLLTSPVLIKSGTWIGENVSILPGVTIGKKCIIGTASVVTKSIPDYSIAVGNPAKVIKYFDFELNEWVKKGD